MLRRVGTHASLLHHCFKYISMSRRYRLNPSLGPKAHGKKRQSSQFETRIKKPVFFLSQVVRYTKTHNVLGGRLDQLDALKLLQCVADDALRRIAGARAHGTSSLGTAKHLGVRTDATAREEVHLAGQCSCTRV
jgi:hypothetical protein